MFKFLRILLILAVTFFSLNLYGQIILPGSGTFDDPYTISTPEQLLSLQDFSNDSYVHYALVNDIDMSGYVLDRAAVAAYRGVYDSEGTLTYEGNQFYGVFIGNGHTISNLTIDSSSRYAANEYYEVTGLFGAIEQISTVYDFGLENVNINGSIYTGGICGMNYGYVTNCRIDGYVAGYRYTGGICGINYNYLYYSYVFGTVTANMENAVFLGGICGINSGFVYDSYAVADIDTSVFYAGGLCGYSVNYGEAFDCFWDKTVAGTSSSYGGVGLVTSDMKLLSTYTNAGWRFAENSSYIQWQYVEGWYPLLAWETNGFVTFPDLYSMTMEDAVSRLNSLGFEDIAVDYNYSELPAGQVLSQSVEAGSSFYYRQSVGLVISLGPSQTGFTGGGTEEDPYLVSTREQLFEVSDSSVCSSRYIYLATDLDFSGIVLNSPIFTGEFTGVFNGSGHKISNLTFASESANLSVFTDIADGAAVENLGLTNVNIEGGARAAGICSNNYGSIEQCYVIGDVRGYNAVGGLCAANYGIINKCYCDIELVGCQYVGGLCGGNSGTVYNSYVHGFVTGVDRVGGLVGTYFADSGAISDCYVSCKVTGGTAKSGAFCGYGYEDRIVSSYWNSAVSGIQTSCGAVGLTDIELRQVISGWDYTDSAGSPAVWQRISGYYPVLAWQELEKSYMPEVTGMQLADAIAALSAAGYEDVITRPYYRLAEPGSVLSQNIPAGDDGFTKSIVLLEYCLDNKLPGAGTEADPYIVSDADVLLAIGSALVSYKGYFLLTDDIDLGSVLIRKSIFASNTATDGSFEGTAFTGTFDGNGHIISNVEIEIDATSYVGLFGYIGDGGVVKDLTVENCTITGDERVGGLCGRNDGTISNCHVVGKVNGNYQVGGFCGSNIGTGVIENSSSQTDVYGDSLVGGFCGGSSGSISQCYSISEVSGAEEKTGGFCGVIAGPVSQCYNMGNVSGEYQVGGFCGMANTGTDISECFCIGAVEGEDYLGGFTGYCNYGTSFSRCLWDSDIAGDSVDLINFTYDNIVPGYTTAMVQNKIMLSKQGWSSFDWTMPEGDYLHLAWEKAGGESIPENAGFAGSGTAEDPWQITSAEEFASIYLSSDYLDDSFVLTADIDMNGYVFYGSVIAHVAENDLTNRFEGTFDGNGHKIFNIQIESLDLGIYVNVSSSYFGVFGCVGPNGTVKNLGIESIEVNSDDLCGTLCGYNAGLIENCYVTGLVSVSDAAAGFCYCNHSLGEIRSCYSESDVYYSENDSYYTSSSPVLVGFCFANDGVISNSYYAGRVGPASLFYESTSANDSTTKQYFSGFCRDNAGIVTDCFWDAERSEISDSDGGTSLTTSQMQNIKSFVQWIGSDSWVMPDGDYPRLDWEDITGTDFNAFDLAGSGTEADPYQVASAWDLLTLANDTERYGSYVMLVADIDLSEFTFDKAVFASNVVPDSGFDGTAFSGVFDGSGHIISHLTIESDYNDYLGLFGKLGTGAVIHDLAVTDVSISGCRIYAGGLCGSNIGGSISRCYVTGTVSGYRAVGTLCGNNEGEIVNCFSDGSLDGEGYTGGFCGRNTGYISTCYAMGDVYSSDSYSGGFCGYSADGTIEYSYSACTFANDVIYSGGFCGSSASNNIIGCFWDTTVSGVGTSSGGTGLETSQILDIQTYANSVWNISTDISGDSTWLLVSGGYPFLRFSAVEMPDVTGMKYLDAEEALAGYGLASHVSYYQEETADYGIVLRQYPAAAVCSPIEDVRLAVSLGTPDILGDGSEAAPYEISSAADFLFLMGNTVNYSSYFVMTADLDFAGTSFESALVAGYYHGNTYEGTSFRGSFDGNGHTISNLVIDAVDGYDDYVGLFGFVSDGAVIKGLGLKNVNINAETAVGALAGRCDGDIYQCFATGTITGSSQIGGLVGIAYGDISESYADISVSGVTTIGGLCSDVRGAVSNSYVLGFVNGAETVGGLCGSFSGTEISNCYCVAVVKGGFSSSSTNTEDVEYVTGQFGPVSSLAGYVSSSAFLSSCLYNCDLTSAYQINAASNGIQKIAGSSVTASMREIQTYLDLDWDISAETAGGTTWVMRQGKYPQLAWQQCNTVALVPDVSGLTLNDAIVYLGTLGFTTGDISYDISADMPLGYVLGQSILKSSVDDIAADAVVDLVVSLGDVSFAGDGSEQSPYLIETAQQLIAFGQDTSMYSSCVRLTGDIDLSGYIFQSAVIAGNTSLTGDGYVGTYFSGVFDGSGCTVANLTIDGQGRSFIGLFGVIDSSAVIKNLKLTNLSISGSIVGGICARNYGGTVLCCGAEGDISGNIYVGGICGYLGGTIEKCYFRGDVSGGIYVGGIAGINYSHISQCYVQGTVGGYKFIYGIAGIVKSGINNCYAACDILLTLDSQYTYHGPISNNAGLWCVNCFYDPDRVSSKVFSTTGSSIDLGMDDFVSTEMKDQATFIDAGWDYSDTDGSERVWYAVEGEYPALAWEYESADTVIGNEIVPASVVISVLRTKGYDSFDIQYQKSDLPSGMIISQYPESGSVYFTGSEIRLVVSAGNNVIKGSGTVSDPYQLDSISDLIFLGLSPELYNSVFVINQDIDSDSCLFTDSVIAADQDPETEEFDGPAFTGTIYGNGHVIRRLNIDSVDGCNIGLFGSIGDGGKVIDLTIESAYVTGKYAVGILAGRSYGNISGCAVSGEIYGYKTIGGLAGGSDGTIAMSSSDSVVSGFENVGGFCGVNTCQINDCFSSGSITGYDMVYYSQYSSSAFTLPYAETGNFGGFVGRNDADGDISDCYTNCEMDVVLMYENSSVSSSDISESDYHGGFCGNNNGIVLNCFWDIDISGEAESFGGFGLVTSNMQNPLFYQLAEWDFDHIWQAADNDYPQLFFSLPADLNGDRAVDIADFSLIADKWQDGYSVADIEILAQDWLYGK